MHVIPGTYTRTHEQAHCTKPYFKRTAQNLISCRRSPFEDDCKSCMHSFINSTHTTVCFKACPSDDRHLHRSASWQRVFISSSQRTFVGTYIDLPLGVSFVRMSWQSGIPSAGAQFPCRTCLYLARLHLFLPATSANQKLLSGCACSKEHTKKMLELNVPLDLASNSLGCVPSCSQFLYISDRK